MKSLGIILFLLTSLLLSAQEIHNGICGARFDAEGKRLLLLDAKGTAIGELGTIFRRFIAELESVSKEDDNSLRLEYRIKKKNELMEKISGVCHLEDNRILFDFVLKTPANTDALADAKLCMITLRPIKGFAKDKVAKTCVWNRYCPERGGTPYQTRDIYLKRFPGENADLWLVPHGNFLWGSQNNEHLGAQRTDETSNRFTAKIELFVKAKNTTPWDLAAERAGRNYSLFISSTKPFNIFESGKPEMEIRVRKIRDFSGKNWDMRVTVHDFDGKKVLDCTEKEIDDKDGRIFRYRLPEGRNIYFIEAALTNGKEEIFTRANLALLPPYEMKHRDKSILGMASAYPNPDRESVFRLMQRLGVRYLRKDNNAETYPKYGIISYYACHAPETMYDRERDYPRLKKWVDTVEKNKNPVWEYGNEFVWKQPKEEKKRLLQCYASWLKAIRAELDRRGLKVKLASFGIPEFSKYSHLQLKETGAFDLLDELSLHPGRGCYTPDQTGVVWSYAGIIRASKNNFRNLGQYGKKINLTEVYAGTNPHDGWKDSYRQAAENLLLEIAIAIAEDIKTFMFFKLHNGTSGYDTGGYYPAANVRNAEYHFGLLMSDFSPKPSLMAYAAAAEYLDGAKFLRYLEIPNTQVKGMEFETPKGKMAILYDRTDGGFQDKWTTCSDLAIPWGGGVNKTVFKDPWVDHWKSHLKHKFRASGEKVAIGDIIGRVREEQVTDGTIELTLSGAPTVVYGLVFGEEATKNYDAINVSSPFGFLYCSGGVVGFFDQNMQPVIRLCRVLRFGNEEDRFRIKDVRKLDECTLVATFISQRGTGNTIHSTFHLDSEQLTVRFDYADSIVGKAKTLSVAVGFPPGVKLEEAVCSEDLTSRDILANKKRFQLTCRGTWRRVLAVSVQKSEQGNCSSEIKIRKLSCSDQHSTPETEVSKH